jgi:hypothetical protein
MSAPSLLFVHVPKTGGISLYTALAQVASLKPAIRFAANTKEMREQYLGMDVKELRRHRIISGHFPLPFFLKRPIEDYQIITVLRSPVDRELSAYFYLKTAEKHPRYEAMKGVSLTEHLERQEKGRHRNPQCSILSEAGTCEAVRKSIDDGRLLAAPMDYLAEFCADLERKWGVGPMKLGHRNATSVRLEVSEIHPDIRRRYEAMTGEDEALYQYVKQKFEREVLRR